MKNVIEEIKEEDITFILAGDEERIKHTIVCKRKEAIKVLAKNIDELIEGTHQNTLLQQTFSRDAEDFTVITNDKILYALLPSALDVIFGQYEDIAFIDTSKDLN